MTRRTLLLAVLLVVDALAGQAAESSSRPYVIVVFGDSLTAATTVAKESQWASLLEKGLRRRHPDLRLTVVNAGVGGNTSREGRARMEKDVLSRHPDLVIVEFGANDETPDGARHVSVEEFGKNLQAMHDAIVRRAGAKMICWPSTPFVNAQHSWGKDSSFAAAGGPDEYQSVYRKCMARVCVDRKMPCVDIDAIFRENIKKHGTSVCICSDGIHHREAGQRLVAEGLLPHVERAIYRKVQ
jgi:lysophospholipase L1-like esterase